MPLPWGFPEYSLTQQGLEPIQEKFASGFYALRARQEGRLGARTGSVAVLQRTSADLRLNPHVQAVFLDGASHEEGSVLAFTGLGHLRTSEVGEVLARTVRRMARHPRRRGVLREDDEDDPEACLAASAVSGQAPPAGPQWAIRLAPLALHPLAYDKPLCASHDGFTLHAATRAGARDAAGREALLRYVLRPPVAQDRLQPSEGGLVRIVLGKRWPDGTVAVDLDQLSLLCRLAASVPPPRHHTVRYAGVLAAASAWRPPIVPRPEEAQPPARERKKRSGRYRTWAELLERGLDGLACPVCPPICRALARREPTRQVAERIFEKAKAGCYPIAVAAVARALLAPAPKS